MNCPTTHYHGLVAAAVLVEYLRTAVEGGRAALGKTNIRLADGSLQSLCAMAYIELAENSLARAIGSEWRALRRRERKA